MSDSVFLWAMDFKQISRFERINVIGTSGSGKTTFARELAELLNLPCYEMANCSGNQTGKSHPTMNCSGGSMR
jgi:shikimate kinase